MDFVTLENQNLTGEALKATFCPSKGMNLISYLVGGFEVMDQSTRSLFDERAAGLGALIGPHFHHRKPQKISWDFDTNRFPHIALVQEKGTEEPFSHGIARYAPWKYLASKTQIKASLHGSDLWNGYPLALLEGFDFSIDLEVRLLSQGLFIKYEIRSEKPSVLGLHYYYDMHKRRAKVKGPAKQVYRDVSTWKDAPNEWFDHKNYLSLPIDKPYDFGFTPLLHQHDYLFMLDLGEEELHINFLTPSEEEVSCQIWHPKDASFVCIEPMTAKDPRFPKLTHNILETKLELVKKNNSLIS